MYSSLFKEACIGSMKLKNKIIMSPMSVVPAADMFGDTARDYCTARAKGGAGMIVAGAVCASDVSPGFWAENARGISSLSADIHSYDARLCLEFCCGISSEDAAKTARAAWSARRRGIDAAMLWMRREDRNGSIACDTVAALKNKCGDDFPIIVKLPLMDGRLDGEMYRLLEARGTDAFMIGCGSYERPVPDAAAEEHFYIRQSAALKKAVSVPVVGQNFLDPDCAVQALDDGKCDFVALGRALLTDSDWADKARRGLCSEIRPCVGCMECIRRISAGEACVCAVNPVLLHERDPLYVPVPARQPCNVLVAGGEISGIVAALLAAERGASVRLWEPDAETGSELKAPAQEAPGLVQGYLRYLKRQLDSSSIRLHPKREPCPEDAFTCCDAVILAAGGCSRTVLPEMHGKDGPAVIYIDSGVYPHGITDAVHGGFRAAMEL